MKETYEESIELLKSLIHHIPLGVLIVNEKRHIIFANEMGEKLHAFLSPVRMDETQTSLGALSFESLFAEDNRRRVWEVMIEEDGDGMKIYTVRVIPLARTDYKMILILDETAAHRRERRERQSERFASLATISGGIAHNFNNIIMGANGYLELAMRELDGESPARKLITQAIEAIQRGGGLTRQLLNISQNQIKEVKIFDAVSFLKEMDNQIREILGHEISYRFVCRTDSTFIEMDPGDLREGLLHLVLNARDAMPDGGEATLTLDVITPDQEGIDIPSTFDKGTYLVINFKDTGRGMTPEVLKQAFDPFFSTQSLALKSGLGLSIVKGMVQQVGGEVFCQSMPNKGTTLTIYLPLKSAPDVTVQKDAQKSSMQELLLLVDDDPNVRESLGAILRLEGYKVIEASSPGEALQIISDDPHDRFILISDMSMADMSGLDLYERLKESYPALKAIFISGFNEESLHQGRNLPEGTHFLQKPFSPMILVTKIREWIGGEA